MIQNDNGINVLDKNEDALEKGKIYALEVVCATETEDNGKDSTKLFKLRDNFLGP